MGKPSKFSFLAGPQKVLYASLDTATPTLASDTIVFLQGGTAKKVTFANMMGGIDGTASSTGLKATNGVLAVDITDLGDKSAPVGADSLMIVDSEAASALKETTLTNIADTLAGTASSTALTDSSGVLTVAPTEVTVAVGADSFVIKDATDGKVHTDSITDVVAGIGGTAATTGLTNASGVLTAAIKIAHLVADEKSSLFFEAVEVDFGVATAVDTKITDAAAAKGKLILALGVVTEVFDGDANSTISISNNTLLGANKMCSDIVVDKDTGTVGDWLGSVFAGMPVAGADATVTAGNDVYAYSAANTNRGNGKMYFVLVFQKTA